MVKRQRNSWTQLRFFAITAVFVLISWRNMTRFPYQATDVDQPFPWLESFSLEAESQQESLRYVHSFRKLDRTLQFLHIPKTAGTTIEGLIAAGQAQIPWGMCRFPSRPPQEFCQGTSPNWFLGNSTVVSESTPQRVREQEAITGINRTSPLPSALSFSLRQFRPQPWLGLPSHWHVLPHLFHPYDNPYDNFDVFSVIRDPFDRALSEFHYQRVVLQNTNWTQMGPTAFYERKWNALYRNGKGLTITRESMIKKYIMDDGHFIPQYEYIMRPLDVRQVDFVVKYDPHTMGQDFNQLVDAFGLSMMQWPGNHRRAMAASRSSNEDNKMDINHDNKEGLAEGAAYDSSTNASTRSSASTTSTSNAAELSFHMQERVKAHFADDYKWLPFQR